MVKKFNFVDTIISKRIMVLTKEICILCNYEQNGQNIDYNTMICYSCSPQKPINESYKYIKDIRFCQYCSYFKYSEKWFNILEKNMCNECSCGIIQKINTKMDVLETIPEENLKKRKRKTDKKNNIKCKECDCLNIHTSKFYTTEQLCKTCYGRNIAQQNRKKIYKCNVCLEEKACSTWHYVNVNRTCSKCYYKANQRRSKMIINCRACKQQKLAFNWYKQGFCDDCYRPAK